MTIADIALFPPRASTTASQVDMLFLFLLTVCGAVTLLVAVLLVYFAIRYRRRSGEVGNPPKTDASDALEWFWTLTPLLFFAGMFIWGAKVYFGAYRPPDDAATIYVVGKQWMWKFQHPEGQREIDSLHVPLGRPIRLLMTSEDVIHSLFIPDFRIHMDLLPGRYTSVWFKPTRVGMYRLFCSQYCGTNHAGMTGVVVVMEPADYQKWLHESAEGSMALQGRKVFLKYRCISCHSGDAGGRAPTLGGLFGNIVVLNDGRTVKADEYYIRESIVYPSAKIVAGYENIMPTYQGQVSEEEIFQLIAYLQSLKPGETPSRVESFPPPTTTPPINTKDR
ncbi:MAG: cytochrome c oxidase subunit II [Planctomycetaceae bacterium]|nr:cytochrome c oxidase subunit II [Planctomycetaceae bacterium]